MIVFSGFLLAVANQFLIIGTIMVIDRLNSWVIVPVVHFIRYLATQTSPRLDRVRSRAVGVVAGAVAVVLVFLLCVVPFPNSFRAPGVVKAMERTQVANETAAAARCSAAGKTWAKRSNAVNRSLTLRNRELDPRTRRRAFQARRSECPPAEGHERRIGGCEAAIAIARFRERTDCQALGGYGAPNDRCAARWRVGGAGCLQDFVGRAGFHAAVTSGNARESGGF